MLGRHEAAERAAKEAGVEVEFADGPDGLGNRFQYAAHVRSTRRPCQASMVFVSQQSASRTPDGPAIPAPAGFAGALSP